MNIPALRKLDAMIIVSTSRFYTERIILSYGLDQFTTSTDEIMMNRVTWITLEAKTSSGMCPKMPMNLRRVTSIEMMINGGYPLLKFH